MYRTLGRYLLHCTEVGWINLNQWLTLAVVIVPTVSLVRGSVPKQTPLTCKNRNIITSYTLDIRECEYNYLFIYGVAEIKIAGTCWWMILSAMIIFGVSRRAVFPCFCTGQVSVQHADILLMLFLNRYQLPVLCHKSRLCSRLQLQLRKWFIRREWVVHKGFTKTIPDWSQWWQVCTLLTLHYREL